MLDFETFKKEHLDSFEPNHGYEGHAEIFASHMNDLGLLAQSGTHYIDGKIIYLSAYWQVVPGNWEVFIIPSIHLPRYIKSVVKDIRLWLRSIQEKHGARRIQAWGDANSIIDRWLSCLGFACEGTLKYYDSDGDKRIWSMTWPHHLQQHSV